MTDSTGPKDLEAVLLRLQEKWQELADLLSNQPRPGAAVGTALPDPGKLKSAPRIEAAPAGQSEIIARLAELEAHQKREKFYQRFILAVLGVILITQAFMLIRPYLGGVAAVPASAPQTAVTQEKPAEPEAQFVGSKTSNRYHYPTCKFAKTIKPEKLITFKSAAEAQERHYKPCPVCKPPPLSP